MANCDYCGKSVDGYPHKCKFCGQVHCSSHLLPEAHSCVGLEEHKKRKIERWRDTSTFSSIQKHEESAKEDGAVINTHSKKRGKKRSFGNKVNGYFLTKYEDLIYWLRKREHHKYAYERRANYLITTILLFVASLVGFSIFYSNAQKLNGIDIWIIKLGGVLIIASLFFAIKYGWRLGKELINILKRQRNWLKYLIIILVIFLLWQSYVNKDTVLNPVFDVYNQTNFSLFAPVSLGNFSLDSLGSPSYDSSNEEDNSFFSDVGKVFKSEPERKDECIQSFSTLNEVRKQEGKKSISWDERAYNLAVARSKDMYERNYFDHVTPEGECVDDFKREYGFKSSEFLAENAGGMSYYSKGSVAGNCDEALDGWLDSRGHRYNLLYTTHKSGAIGCYYEICIFLGVNNDGFGAKPCTSGDEGMAFWDTAPKQPGEV